jgi:hypothetical protein
MKAKMRVTHRSAPPFSLLMKRRTIAPKIGKKINRDRIGIPKIVMKPAPLIPPHPPLLRGGRGGFRFNKK